MRPVRFFHRVPVRLLATVLLAAFVGCGGNPASNPQAGPRAPTRAPLRVFAAASLTAAFGEMAAAFERDVPEYSVELSFAGAPQLALQIREGAPADVFASADPQNMQRVVDAGRVSADPIDFATNRLAIVVGKGNPAKVTGLGDLQGASLRVALCAPEVPAGRYAREALRRGGFAVRSVSDEPNVKALVTKVQLHELDAGIVYATDVNAPGVEGIPIPNDIAPTVRYPIATVRNGQSPEGARAFVHFVLSASGQGIMKRHGFTAP